VDLARHLNLHVVADGIETREVWDRLAELGCDTAQGYLLSRPLPPEELSAWLQERAERPSATTSPARREGQADDTQGRPGAIHAAQE
jgi:sensor c-di-GMP phosphodiesterase-like protein